MKFKKSVIVDSTEENLMNYFLTLTFPSEKRDALNGKLYGSNAGYCARQNVLLSKIETETQFTLSQKLRMELGNCTENYFLNLFEINNILIADSIKITDKIENITKKDKHFILFDDSDINYSGKVDFIIVKEKKELWLLDCKAPSKLHEKDSLKYVRQIQFYSAVLGIDKIGLLYQPTSVKDEFYKELNGTVNVIDSSYQTLLDVSIVAFHSSLCWKNELLPSISEKFHKTVQCKYCDFNNFCWGNQQLQLYPFVQDNDLEKELLVQAEHMAKEWLLNRNNRFEKFFDKFIKEKN